jgi:hypothetical protein
LGESLGRKIGVSRTAVIVSVVIAAAIGAVVTWRATRHATLPQASCGSAVTHLLDGGTVAFRADRRALACFGAAARPCRPASIELTEMGVDDGTDYVFVIEPGASGCQVTEWSQGYNIGSQTAVSSASCLRTAVTSKGVTLNCGGQDVLIPARVTWAAPRPQGRSAEHPKST